MDSIALTGGPPVDIELVSPPIPKVNGVTAADPDERIVIAAWESLCGPHSDLPQRLGQP